MRNPTSLLIVTTAAVLCFSSCSEESTKPREKQAVIKDQRGESRYPRASDPARVGSYKLFTNSGAGYFWDSVLEYRVWYPAVSGDDTCSAFADYETALDWAKGNPGADSPLVLILLLEHINEPKPGVFEAARAPRTTEWRPEWLAGARRRPASIDSFLNASRK